MLLNQEVENIKDKFSEIEKVMIKLEMQDDLEKAGRFLKEYSHLAYYNIVSCLGQLVDRFVKEEIG